MILAAFQFIPEEASQHARDVDLLYFGLLGLSAVIVFGLAAFILYCLIRYRAGSTAPRGPLEKHPLRLEITWTVLPFLIFLVLFVIGARLYLQTGTSGKGNEPVYIVARQWMWDISYPSGRRAHNEIVVPLGRETTLLMNSEDVIHSFYLPAMRLKQDVLPGRYVRLSFTPDRSGEFPFTCAEYCGTNHSRMSGVLRVLPAADYQDWLAKGGGVPNLASRGATLFAEQGCAGCHSPGSSVHAPSLVGIYGRRVPLAGGTFVEVDEQYLRDSILLPEHQVAAGYAPIMPTFQGQISEIEILALVEYIKSLESPDILPPNTTRPAPERLDSSKD